MANRGRADVAAGGAYSVGWVETLGRLLVSPQGSRAGWRVMVKDPWFRPLYRRVLTLVVLAGWGLFELLAPTGGPGGGRIWLMIAGAIFAYAAWGFFFSGYYTALEAEDEGDAGAGPADGGDGQ